MPKHNTPSGLTLKQERFVAEYLIDGNAKRSAEAAGYSVKTAVRIGSELLAKPAVRAAIDAGQKRTLAKLEVTAERVLQEVARVAFFDIRKIFNADGTLKRVHELDDDTAAAVAGIEVVEIGADGQLTISKKIKASDKGGALDKLMRHLGLYEKDNGQLGEAVSRIVREVVDPKANG